MTKQAFFEADLNNGSISFHSCIYHTKMYKWHVHSAIGRGRPLTNDLLRAADGIAASLRQFSVSVSRAAEDEPSMLSAPELNPSWIYEYLLTMCRLSSHYPQPQRKDKRCSE
jgi:hypothetical protein